MCFTSIESSPFESDFSENSRYFPRFPRGYYFGWTFAHCVSIWNIRCDSSPEYFLCFYFKIWSCTPLDFLLDDFVFLKLLSCSSSVSDTSRLSTNLVINRNEQIFDLIFTCRFTFMLTDLSIYSIILHRVQGTVSDPPQSVIWSSVYISIYFSLDLLFSRFTFWLHYWFLDLLFDLLPCPDRLTLTRTQTTTV